jgi:hypothetical protein
MINPRSRTAIRALGLLAFAALISGCSSGPTIITNSDPSAEFISLQTFDFLQPLSTDSGNVRSLLSTHLIAATTNELEKRGWRHEQNNPDVVINFMLETHEQIRTRQSSASVGIHRGGRYGMWGGTMSTPTIEQTTQGALSVDMIDPARNQLIWEGTATNRVTDNIRQNQEEAVHSFVAAIFAEFP